MFDRMNRIVAACAIRHVSVSTVLALLLTAPWTSQKTVLAQAITSTVTAATDTATPTPTFVPTPTVNVPSVYVPDRVNVRRGPGTNYEKVGVLVAGQYAPAIGRSVFGEWIAIEYPVGTGEYAWVYSPLVLVQEVIVEDLPEMEPPATPTLPALPAAAIKLSPDQIQSTTRLPTFTPAPPVAQPTFATPEIQGGTLPPIMLIGGLFSLGILSGIVAILRQRV